MSYRRRYSPSYSSSPSTSLIKGPSSIYTTTSNVLGGGSYLRDSVSSLRSGSSLSPRRYPRTTNGVTTSAASRLTSTMSYSTALPYQSRSRSARISSYLNNDSDIFSRPRSRSPTFASTNTTSSWRPRTTTDYTSSKNSALNNLSTYRSRHRSADLDGSYSVESDPIVAAISDRLSRESNSNEHRFSLPTDYRSSGYGSQSNFDNDSASDSCIGYDRPFSSLTTQKTNFGKSDYFNQEEKQFLSSLNQLVNNARYTSNDKLSTISDRLWSTNDKMSNRRYDDILGELTGGSLVRSNSFHELRDLEISAGLSSTGMMQARDRHKTLAYGVSAADLGMVVNPSATSSALAAINFLKTNPLPDFNFSNRAANTDYEQAGNVGIRGPAAIAPLSGFKSEMSTAALAHHEDSVVAQMIASVENDTSSSSGRGGHTEERKSEKSQNGEVDYKKLWEDAQLENIRLRDDLNKVRDDLKSTKKKLDTAIAVPPPGSNSSLSDAEKKEKLALEKKLSEMEEELKLFQKLKAENERLKSESRALARVVSRLSAATEFRSPSSAASN